jgi:lipopolysaccharide transport system permease protein
VAGSPQGFPDIIRSHPGVPDVAGLLLAYRLFIYRTVLLAVTRIELGKRYSGSFLGVLWYPIYWAVLLGMYCFVYIVIFRQRMPEFGNFGYVLFIFSGLVPYFGVSDAIGTGAGSIRANTAVVRNAIFPVELIPARAVLVALASQAVAVGFLVILAVAGGFGGWHFLYLPVPFVAEFLLVMGIVWALSAITVVVPDVQQVTGLLLWLFLFVSPVGFTLTQVPPGFQWIIWMNPLAYLIEEFRFALLGIRTIDWTIGLLGLSLFSLAFFLTGAGVFRRLIVAFGDYQ